MIAYDLDLMTKMYIQVSHLELCNVYDYWSLDILSLLKLM